MTLALCLAAVTFSGCLEAFDSPREGSTDATTDTTDTTDTADTSTDTTDTSGPPDTNSPPVGGATFSVVYISGHLGHYDSCPEQALPVGGISPDGSGEDAFPSGGADRDDSGNCLDPCGSYGCEAGELNVRLTNDGPAPLSSLEFGEIELLLAPDDYTLHSRALDVNVDEAGLPSSVAVGAFVDIRVTFQGLRAYTNYRPSGADSAGFQDGDCDGDCGINGAKVRVVFTSNQYKASATSPTLYPVTDIDT